MDDVEARLKCLELASVVCGRVLDNSANGIVEIATVFYAFAMPQPVEAPVVADKPKRGRPPRVPDYLE